MVLALDGTGRSALAVRSRQAYVQCMSVGLSSVWLAFAGLDFGEARWGISRDLEELRSSGAFGWVLITVSLALPGLALVLVVFARSWLALVPLATAAGLFGLWFLYYATDWFSNPGQGAWLPAFTAVLLAWGVLLAALLDSWRRKSWALPFRRP
jgi:hypothetical protein